MTPSAIDTPTAAPIDPRIKDVVIQKKDTLPLPAAARARLEKAGIDLSNGYPERAAKPLFLDDAFSFRNEDREYFDAGARADKSKTALFSAAKEVINLTSHIGTEIVGLQLKDLTDQQRDELALLIAERSVVFFRDQDITPQEQKKLGEHFGEVEIHPQVPHVPGVPGVTIIWPALQAAERPASFRQPGGASKWHTDLVHEKQPAGYTHLHNDTIPSIGGDTLWASGYAAYSKLSPEFRKIIDGRKAIYISAHTYLDRNNPEAGPKHIERIIRSFEHIQLLDGSLFVEFITGGSPPFIPNLDEPTAADNQNEPYIPYYQYLLSQKNADLPQVISNSYGDDEQTVPKNYAVRVCNMTPALAQPFTPTFPGSCPYILSVGGTQAVTPEVAWVDGSGGFSNYFSRAWYQEAAVEIYLNKYISPATKKYYEPYTNFNGCGFPDISAHSLTPDYQVIYDGQPSPSGGTSAAAPVVAAIIGLLNDARFRVGKGSLGFINPWLYAIGFTSLNDITGGGSIGCNGVNGQTGAVIPGGGVIPYASWNATVGWDPVTGLGTPNFEKLKALVLSF